jgi:asparagine synthase (glutamine-hydrolysing)
MLREAFADSLPGYILRRPKNPMSHSSGLHERARMYRPLFARLHRSFGYDLHDPVRSDFSVLLDSVGGDLDLARARARQDYRLREHARDLAGDVARNVAASVVAPSARGPAGST